MEANLDQMARSIDEVGLRVAQTMFMPLKTHPRSTPFALLAPLHPGLFEQNLRVLGDVINVDSFPVVEESFANGFRVIP
jgi:hypothetical protein